jgi:hypothetical protein
METGRILPGQSQPPAKIAGAQHQDGEQAFHDMAKSKGNSKEDVAFATTERTRLTRVRKLDRSKKKSISSLFAVDDEGSGEEDAVYYTVIDPTTGQIITLRLLAVA